jgi:predicted HAD superfamily Cof-like phosphohydrolase
VKTLYQYVRDFMQAGRQLDYPTTLGEVPSDTTLRLRDHLIQEELDEYRKAVRLAVQKPCPETLAEVADAICDLLYVVTGAGIAWSFPLPEMMDEVQRSNMEKFGPGSWRRDDGKVMKPVTWTPPDLTKFFPVR